MKKNLFHLIFLFFSIHAAFSQAPIGKIWDKRYGGYNQDSPNSFQETKDGGFIIAGWSNSGIGGNKTEDCRGGQDFWMVKTDSLGTKEWDKRFGGTYNELIESLQQTNDGGYIFAGSTSSDSSTDITQQSRGAWDFWIVKTDSLGNKQWDKRYGGTFWEHCKYIVKTSDGGYLAGGYSSSDSSGDKTQDNIGAANNDYDFWIVKIDSIGNKQWDKSYGSSSDDFLFSIVQTSNGGFVLGGFSDGIGHDISQPQRGGYDFWIIKIDSVGNKLWDSRVGGSKDEYSYSMQQTTDNGFILFGVSLSGISGDKSQPVLGYSDYWIVKLDSLGNKEWDKSFGGTGSEWGFGYPYKQGDIFLTKDGGFLFGSYSNSLASGNKTESSFYGDGWVIKTDSLGNKIWDKTLFTKGFGDVVLPIQTKDSCFVFANYLWADSGFYKTQSRLGSSDFWLIKFCDCNSASNPIINFSSDTQNICASSCIEFTNFSDCYDSCRWSFPGGVPSISTSPTPTVCYPDTGEYPVTLTLMNSNGRDSLIQSNYVHVSFPYPTVTLQADTLTSSSATTYQWYFENIAISGETSQTYIAFISGYYHVCITDSLGCSNCSDSVYFDVNSVSKQENRDSKVRITLNPFSNEVKIISPSKGEIVIYDMAGKEILNQIIPEGVTQLNIENISQGIYLLNYFNRRVKENCLLIKY